MDRQDILEGDVVAVPLRVRYVDETGRISLGDEHGTHFSLRPTEPLTVVRHALKPGDRVRVLGRSAVYTFLGEVGGWATLDVGLPVPQVFRRDDIRRASDALAPTAPGSGETLEPVLNADGDAVGLEPVRRLVPRLQDAAE